MSAGGATTLAPPMHSSGDPAPSSPPRSRACLIPQASTWGGDVSAQFPAVPPLAAGPASKGSAARPALRMPGSFGNSFTGRSHSAEASAVNSAALSGFNLDRLLAGLQRGAVPHGDQNVSFLCSKFTALAERLKEAEVGQREFEDRSALCEMELRAGQAEDEAERGELEASAQAASDDLRHLEVALEQSQRDTSSLESELRTSSVEMEMWARRRTSLDEECVSESTRLVEASSRLKHRQSTRTPAQADLRRIQGHLQSLSAQYQTSSAELAASRERSGRDEKRLADLRVDLASEEDRREHATASATAMRDELSDELRELASLKERVIEAQTGLQHTEDEIQKRVDRGRVLNNERRKHETRIENVTRQVQGFSGIERGLERVMSDTAECRAKAGLEEVEARQAAVNAEALAGALVHAEQHHREKAFRHEETEIAHSSVRAEVLEQEDEHAHLATHIEELQHEQAAGGGIRQNLENEMQLLLEEADRLRHEREEKKNDRLEMHQRMQLIVPALGEAKVRARDLEEHCAAVQAESAKDRQLSERLEREVLVCHEKMKALRERNSKLGASCSEFEGQLTNASSRRQGLPSKELRKVSSAKEVFGQASQWRQPSRSRPSDNAEGATSTPPVRSRSQPPLSAVRLGAAPHAVRRTAVGSPRRRSVGSPDWRGGDRGAGAGVWGGQHSTGASDDLDIAGSGRRTGEKERHPQWYLGDTGSEDEEDAMADSGLGAPTDGQHQRPLAEQPFDHRPRALASPSSVPLGASLQPPPPLLGLSRPHAAGPLVERGLSRAHAEDPAILDDGEELPAAPPAPHSLQCLRYWIQREEERLPGLGASTKF